MSKRVPGCHSCELSGVSSLVVFVILEAKLLAVEARIKRIETGRHSYRSCQENSWNMLSFSASILRTWEVTVQRTMTMTSSIHSIATNSTNRSEPVSMSRHLPSQLHPRAPLANTSPCHIMGVLGRVWDDL